MHSMRRLLEAMLPEGYDVTPDQEQRFTAFIRDLEQISAKHGVVLQVTGGVSIEDAPLDAVRYSDDPTSGDITPLQTKRQDMSAPRRWGHDPAADIDQMRRDERKARIYRSQRRS